MWRKFQLTAVLLAWLLATGSQWDLAQVFAWGRMFSGYAQTMSLTAALRETFDAKKLCPICEAVQTAKQQQDNPATPDGKAAFAKITLIFQPAPVIVFTAPEVPRWSPSDPIVPGATRAAPPLPPPCACVA